MSVGPRTADALLAALVAMAMPACTTRTRDSAGGSPHTTGAPPSPPPPVPAATLNQHEVPTATANQREVATPAELRADYIRAVQARAAAAYPVEPMAATSVRMRSPAQRLLAVLSPEDVQIKNTANGDARGGLALAGFGCEQQRAAVRAAAPRAEGNRAAYDRGGLLESYASGPLGLSQGFTVAAPPPCRAQGGGAVVVELAVRGPLQVALLGGARVELRDHAGREAFTYADLFAHDAKGQTVAATMTVKGQRLLLHVDDAGAVYPLQIEALISTRQPKLLARDGADYDRFGASVAVSGDLAVVGAARNDERGTDAGAAYVLVRGDTGWTQQAKLTAADSAANDNFGVSVAVSGDTALVGDMFNDGLKSDAGAAYVFVRGGPRWTQQAKLMARDGASDDQLGISVALSGDTALVGTINHSARAHHAGAAYVFVRDGTRWTQQAKLMAADGAELDQFGLSVAVSGDTAVVGAHGDDDLGDGSGSAYVFVRSGTRWTQQAKLTAGDGAAGDSFGFSVAVSGDTALVGAHLDDDHGPDSGSAYVFVRGGTRWTQQAKLTAADGTAGDNFGVSVALLGDTALVGMPNDNDGGAGAGSAYVFLRGGTTWTQEAKLAAADGTSADLFGSSVALSEHAALVGALGDDDLGDSSGSAYAYMPPWSRATREPAGGAVRLRSVRGLSR